MEKRNTIYKILRMSYVVMLIIYWIGRMIFPIKDILASTYALVALLLLSIVFVAFDFFVKKRSFDVKYAVLFILYLIWSAVVLLVNNKYGVWDGLVTIGFLAIQFYVFYIASPDTVPDIKKEVKVFSYVLCICAFILALIGIAMYLYEIDFSIIEGKVLYSQGFFKKYGRAWGILISANLHTGTLALLTMYFSILNMILAKKKKAYIFNILNIVVQTAMLVLSGSRSTSVAAYISVGVIGWIYSKEYVKNRVSGEIKREIVRALLGVGCIVVLFFAMTTSTKCLPIIKKSIGVQDEQKVAEWADKYIYPIYRDNGYEVIISDPEELGDEIGDEIERYDMETKEDMSNGRFEIWSDSFKIAKNNIVFGVGNNNITNYIKAHDIETILSRFGHCHNTYIELLVSNGILGFILVISFLVACAWELYSYQRKREKCQELIGVFSAIVCALLLVIFFSEDIFFQMSLNSIVFWLMLGYIMRIIKIEKTDTSSKFAFVCETGLHVYNSLEFVLGNVEDSKNNSDIYIYHQFKNSHEYAKKIKEAGMFNNVYEFKKYDNASGVMSKVQTLQRLITNKITLNKYAKCDRSYINKKYEVLVIGMITQFSNNLRALSRDARIYFIEDGMGTYSMNIEKEFMSKSYRMINKYFLGNRLNYNPEKIYLNNPEFNTSSTESEFCKLPLFSEMPENRAIAQKCFAYCQDSQYGDRKFVFISQPLLEVKNADVAKEKEILQCMGRLIKDETIVRIHPRQKSEEYKEFKIDEVNNFWELECDGTITDKHVLIAMFSTAQFTPQIVALREPYVIFLYKIVGGFEKAQQTVEQLINSYKDPQKIFVPKTIEEFEDILKRLRDS